MALLKSCFELLERLVGLLADRLLNKYKHTFASKEANLPACEPASLNALWRVNISGPTFWCRVLTCRISKQEIAWTFEAISDIRDKQRVTNT